MKKSTKVVPGFEIMVEFAQIIINSKYQYNKINDWPIDNQIHDRLVDLLQYIFPERLGITLKL